MQLEPGVASDLASKTQLRMSISANRSARAVELARSPETMKKLAATLAHRFLSLPETHEITSVAAYTSIGGEPPTDLIRRELRRHRCQVWLPYAHSLGHLEWVADNGERLIPGPMGIPVPQGGFLDVDLAGAKLIIVPALAVDRAGTRLGRGAGYYDRALANVPRFSQGGPLRVALVYEEELVDQLPHEEHDQKMDVVITPTAIFHVDPSASLVTPEQS